MHLDGGFKAVRKTAESARTVFDHVKRLEAIGCYGAEFKVVPDRAGEKISENTTMIMLGMGDGPGADAQYLFTEGVLGNTAGHNLRHAKTYKWGGSQVRAADDHICACGGEVTRNGGAEVAI
ncbi:MAG: 3-methyl-2-oxobutanoate hydroxymethyltransferase [Geminicoccaceae bacterium]